MKDIPLFTSEYGVASLTLREIPYRGIAYVKLQATEEPALLIDECVDFCRAAGAERIYASGHTYLEMYPYHTTILRLQCDKVLIEDTDAALWPVQEHTLPKWLDLYNQKAVKIPNAAWMTAADGGRMLGQGEGYFIHRGEELLGIGRVTDGQIAWLSACRPKAGVDVVRALCHAVMEDTISLEVSAENVKAMALYESMGFVPCEELSRWYKIY